MTCLPSSSIMGLMATSFKRTHATHCASQDCCCHSLCPRARPPLTHASVGDSQTLMGRSVPVSCGGHCSFLLVLVYTRFCLCPPSVSGGYDCTPPTILLWLLLCPWSWDIFFWWFQHSPVNGCSAVPCNFVVLAGEGDHTSFYSTSYGGSLLSILLN